jgi:hypothetical protein
MLDGSGVKAMPGSIPAPRVHSIIEKKENTGSQMGHTKKIFLKKGSGFNKLCLYNRVAYNIEAL